MSGNIFHKAVLTVGLLAAAGITALADGGTHTGYAPYSIFGVGDLFPQGTAYNRTMGGVGIGVRNNRFLNPVNPAAVTARDSLAMMMDFSLYESNKIFTQGGTGSINNIFNLGNLMVSFPIWRSLSAMVGIMPYSSTGFDYSNSYPGVDDAVLLDVGNVAYSASGEGGLYQLFGGLGFTLFDRLSLGGQYIWYFGKIEKKFSQTVGSSAALGITDTYTSMLRGGALKAGIQYEQPIGSLKLTVGATYKTAASMKGYIKDPSGQIDTLSHSGGLSFAGEIGAGLSLRKADKWMVAFDWTRSDWTLSGLDTRDAFAGTGFNLAVKDDYRLGFEYIPNRGDIRYYLKNCTYRAGLFYTGDYYTLDGNAVTTKGISLGMTLPVFRWYNGITIGMELGQRDAVASNLIKERYINFTLGVNLFDIWFQKRRYE